MMEIAAPAFVLRRRAFGESDRIVTLMAAGHGKITGIAKGAKNSRRRFGGTLEPFVHVRAVFRPREGSDLVFLVRCEMIETLRTYRSDLDRFAAGSYLLELTDKMVHGPEPGGEIYRLVHDALVLINRGSPIDPVLRAFELHLLASSGYAPSLDECRGCGTPNLDAVLLCVERGGLFCRSCVRPGDRVRPVSAATARELGRLAQGDLASSANVDPRVLSEAAIVAEQLLSAVLTSPLRSRDFLHRARVDSVRGVR